MASHHPWNKIQSPHHGRWVLHHLLPPSSGLISPHFPPTWFFSRLLALCFKWQTQSHLKALLRLISSASDALSLDLREMAPSCLLSLSTVVTSWASSSLNVQSQTVPTPTHPLPLFHALQCIYHHQKLFYLLFFLVLVSPLERETHENQGLAWPTVWNSVWNKVGIYTLGGQMRTQTELPIKSFMSFLSTAVGSQVTALKDAPSVE